MFKAGRCIEFTYKMAMTHSGNGLGRNKAEIPLALRPNHGFLTQSTVDLTFVLCAIHMLSGHSP